MTPRVVLIGSFPPPVGGAALINQLVLDTLRDRGADAIPLDVSGPALAHNRSLNYHVQRVAANVRAGWRARQLASPDSALYLVPDAGVGAWYTAALARLATAGFGRIVVHHHSCRYIEEKSPPIALLTEAMRERATHVFLTEGMSEAYRRRYGPVRAMVATNARFVAAEADAPAAISVEKPLRLGHLSNLCRDKGFFTVLDTFDTLLAAGRDVTLLLAGPVLEPEVGHRIEEAAARYGNRFRYVGPVAGDAKRDVYRAIDLFLFPTQFRQEAAPLVIYEAMAAGVPVLATDRGVIAELIQPETGAVCDREAYFARFALDWVVRHGSDDRRAVASTIKQQARAAAAASLEQYDKLLDLLAPRELGK